MKYVRATVVVVVIAMVVLISFYCWDSAKNRGYTFGYYGEFNNVSNALAKIKSITTLNSWHNDDISLEVMVFEIRTADGKTNRVFLSESETIRKMSGKQLENALVAEIQKASSAGTNASYR